ncbi:hypothetical protein PPL_08193 [Heterostelium album PN500]|uniref:Uncharacterized protein n=1 Tax=Heterostelium pallidum (strain ATCC 26659 / Pp 5 / PN500) TaxID=670386 RepID=D3BIV8_HETP5|nr:hypothetical protein PPL_08193 [Heterostelium album PN500]EFA78732.1 hypothetical protein PPL_08193 [Heterostelium album PN500]|eukprot:XP_020430856.1 hypothetical protein PPL_08193 [Heterostelium album PN500]
MSTESQCPFCGDLFNQITLFQHNPKCYFDFFSKNGITPLCTCSTCKGESTHSSSESKEAKTTTTTTPTSSYSPISLPNTVDYVVNKLLDFKQCRGTNCAVCNQKITKSPFGKIRIGNMIVIQCRKSHVVEAGEATLLLGILNNYVNLVEQNGDDYQPGGQSIFDIDFDNIVNEEREESEANSSEEDDEEEESGEENSDSVSVPNCCAKINQPNSHKKRPCKLPANRLCKYEYIDGTVVVTKSFFALSARGKFINDSASPKKKRKTTKNVNKDDDGDDDDDDGENDDGEDDEKNNNKGKKKSAVKIKIYFSL